MFPESYSQGRRSFLDLVANTSGTHYEFPHPATGPQQAALSLDVASWGNASAANVLLITSGTHGIEGFAGSGVQATLLSEDLPEQLSADTRLIMVHAINPYGFAWQRRVNEDNVDLNRNFIDHDAAHPRNENYAVFADFVAPAEWTDATPAAIANSIFEQVGLHGLEWAQAALTGGQYDFPDGFFYGGRQPTWSNRTMREVARRFLTDAERILVIDVHTGLGAHGEAECIIEYAPDSELYRIASQVWGERIKSTLSGGSQSAAVSGSMISGLSAEIGPQLIGTGLEYGTVQMTEVMLAMLADQWLHRFGDIESEQGQAIKAEMRRVFYPDDAAWRDAVMEIARDVVDSALDYLAG